MSVLLQRNSNIGILCTVDVTMLEHMLKPCMQTSCGKGVKDLRIKVSEDMEEREAVPQHLQLVPVVQFSQKLQFLLAVPEK